MTATSRTIERASALPALPAVACATAVTALLWPYTARTPLALYYLAVLVASIYGGLVAGVLAIVLSAVLADLFFLSSNTGLALDGRSLFALGLFATVGFAIVFLGQRLRQREAALRVHEKEVERLNRLYAALSQINQAIVWTKNRDDLFQKVCNVLVEYGGFQASAIDWHDESGAFRRVAAAGDASVAWREGDPTALSRGTADPFVCARRDARAYISTGTSSMPHATGPTGPDSVVTGPRACAVFPVGRKGDVQGTLAVYADDAAVFQDKEIALLNEAAVDVSFAVEYLVREQERVAAYSVVEREQRFSNTLIEAMPGILYLYDENGRFLRFNQNFERVSGYSAAEIRTMHPLDFFASEEKELLAERISDVFARGAAFVEANFVAKDGTRIPYLFTGRRIELDGAACLCGMGIDMSARKDAEAAFARSEERYRTTLDNILEGCQLIGFDWRYIYLNAAASNHNRRPNQELLGRTMMESWPGIEGTPVFALLKRCLEERIALYEEVEFVFPDGSKGWFDVRSQAVPEGVFVLSIDITARKRAEADRNRLLSLERLAKDELELKVVERTAELKTALVRAEAADRLKSAFLATMSHELRTPLNSILGFTGIMLQGLPGPLNPEQNKQLGMVNGSAQHLLALINDVLDISKIEAGELDLQRERFRLRESIERVAATVQPLAQKRGLSLQVSVQAELESMSSDRRRFEQILLNLVNNAVKFTERGIVQIRAAIVAELPEEQRASGQAARVKISVEDTGIGIKADDLQTLFKPFRQIDSGLARQHEGTGLGLAICGRLTALLGGQIVAESVYGTGSTFTVTLPIEPPLDDHADTSVAT